MGTYRESGMNNYWLIGGGAALGLLLIASVAVAVMQDEAEFAPGSPEGAVQDYLRALDEDDFTAAYDALSPELRERCAIEDIFGGNRSGRWGLDDRRITLEETRTLEGTTFVTVRMAEYRGGGPFSSYDYDFEETFALRRFDDRWRFTEFPWPHFSCDRSDAGFAPPRYID